MTKINRIFILIFLIGNVGSFFTIGTSLFVFLRYFSTILILLLLCFNYRKYLFDKKILTIFLTYLVTFYLLPIVLIVLDIYDYGKSNILVNAHYYLATIFCCLFISNFYQQEKRYNFFKDFAWVTAMFLIIGMILFKDVSLNFNMLLNNVLQNTRNDRSYLGFNNPNQVAITVTVLIISTYFSNIRPYIKYLSYIFCFLILLNTGSRTPLFSLAIAGIILLVYVRFVHLTNRYMKYLIFTFLIGISVVSVLLILNYLFTASSDFFANLDTLTTNRLGRQIETIDFLARSNHLWFGVGMFNTSFFNTQNQFLGLHPDSYYTYSLVTTGVVGLCFNLILIFLIVMKAFLMKNKQLVFVGMLCVIYAVFEGTLFFPTSLLTILLLITLFLTTRRRAVEDAKE